jgi:hypothetical protein
MVWEAWTNGSTCLNIWKKTLLQKDVVSTVVEEYDVPLSELK